MKMKCPNILTCHHKQIWYKPVWAQGKEPNENMLRKHDGIQVGEQIVPCGHCIPHEHTTNCECQTGKCPSCVPE